MPLTLEMGPALEPVPLDEARRYLRVDGTDDDSLIQSLITAARLHIEAHLGRALINQTWRIETESPCPSALGIPLAPVSSIESVKKVADGTESDVAPELYQTHLLAGRARLDLDRLTLAEGETLRVRFIAGYGATATDVPDTIREAIRRLIAYWFETRGTVEAGAGIPPSVEVLLASYRSVRL